MSLSRTLARTTLSTTRTLATATRSFHVSSRRNDIFADANQEVFSKAVANKDKVVLVDFYAEQLSPVLKRLAETDSDVKTGSGAALDLVTVDADVEQALAQNFKVAALPTVIAFRDGKPLGKFVGAMPEASVRNFLKSL
ncbi:hypothetical protein EIP86_004366 [Pleurotus ostreatoroseus]|nr:hypothetical protein EIP86_004366 [Pleurotus ostreatoroseus]